MARRILRGRARVLGVLGGDEAAQDIPVGRKVDIATLFPGLRLRHDGWTHARTQRFLDTLAYTGCVTDAARVAGLSTAGARRMKRRFPKFSAAWDDALSRAGQGLMAVAYQRAVDGRETVIIRQGQEVERRITPSDAILGLLLKRGDLAGSGLIGGKTPDDYLSLEEWQQHKRFDAIGRKIVIENPVETNEKFVAKIMAIRARLNNYAATNGACPTFKQTLPEGWPNQSMAELLAGGLIDPDALNGG